MGSIPQKTTCIFVPMILINSISIGQHLYFENNFTIIDSARFEIFYKVEYVEDTLNPSEKLVDRQVLQIGDRYSKYYSTLLFGNDSINTVLEEQGAVNMLAIPKGADSHEVIKDNKTKNITVTYRSDETIFRYSEPYPAISWTIQHEKKMIRQHSCQLATCTFRGRKYEAWFAPDIHIHEGPYKFGGLPGLILEIKDSQMQFYFSCITIKAHNIKEPVKIRNWPYTETTREKLSLFLHRKYRNITEFNKSKGISTWISKNGRLVEAPQDFSLPFNPIELE